MIAGLFIQGHAIVSDDDRIAAGDGTVPTALRNETDWGRFQAALDSAEITVLGRRGHEANPNHKGRDRLVLSSTIRGIERRADAWWWDPARISVEAALAVAAPNGGIAAIVGGRRVFDLFLRRFDEFHLTRAKGVVVPGGIPVFSSVAQGISAEQSLRRDGLTATGHEVIDPKHNVAVTIWRRMPWRRLAAA